MTDTQLATTPQSPPVSRKGRAQLRTLAPARPGDQPSWGLVKQTADGEVVAIQVSVRLSKALKHFGLIPGTSVPSIWAGGYNRLNQIMGISEVTVSKIKDDRGVEHDNPWHERRANGSLIRIIHKMGGYGRNAAGNKAVKWAVLHYEVEAYFANELYSAWAKGGKPKAWGQAFVEGRIPDEFANSPTHQAVHIPGGTVIVLDLAHPEALDLMLNRLPKLGKVAQRTTETIVWERILRVFAGQRYVDELPGGYAEVPVTAWIVPDPANVAEIQALAADAEAGETTTETVVDVIDGGVRTDPEDHAAVEDELAPEVADADLTPTTSTEGPPPSPVRPPVPAAPPARTPPKPKRTPSPAKAAQALGPLRNKIVELSNQLSTADLEKTLAQAGISGADQLDRIDDPRALGNVIGWLQQAVMASFQEPGAPNGTKGGN